MIYAIEALGTGFIKFGVAKSVGKRIRELDVGCPHELHIVAVANWPNEAESAIHALLSNDLVKGEWYQDGVGAEQVIGWMQSKDSAYGLERLRLATGRKIEVEVGRDRLPSQARARRLTRSEREALAGDRRRSERQAWWDAQGSARATTASGLSGARKTLDETALEAQS